MAKVDIPRSFLQTKLPKEEPDIHVILEGRVANLLVKNTPTKRSEMCSQT